MDHVSSRKCCLCMFARYAVLILVITLSFMSSAVMAAKWNVQSSVTVSENYSDNINLRPKPNAVSELVTVIRPKITVSGQGRRLKLNLDYSLLSSSYNPNTNGANPAATSNNTRSITKSFRAQAKSELVRNTFFVNALVSRSQVGNTRGSIQRNNSIIKNDNSTLLLYSLSPQFRSVIASQIGVDINVSARNVYSEAAQAPLNYKTYGSSIRLNSIARNSRLSWDAKNSTSVEKRKNSPVDYKSSRGELNIRYRLYKTIDYIASTGYIDSSLRSAVNGSYFSFGLGWRPSSKVTIDLLSGTKLQRIKLLVRPSSRTVLIVTWMDRKQGERTGFSWNGSLSLKSKYFIVNGIHLEQVTNYQRNFVNNQQNQQISTGFEVTTSLFNRIRSTVEISTNRKKLNLRLKGYVESREFIEPGSDTNSEVRGSTAGLVWNVSRTLKSGLTYGAEDLVALGANPGAKSDRLKYTSFILTYSTKKKLNATLNFQKTQKIAGIAASQPYSEKRIILRVTYKF